MSNGIPQFRCMYTDSLEDQMLMERGRKHGPDWVIIRTTKCQTVLYSEPGDSKSSENVSRPLRAV